MKNAKFYPKNTMESLHHPTNPILWLSHQKTWWHIIAQLLSLFCFSLFCHSEISICSSSSFPASGRWRKLILWLRILYADSSFSCCPFNTHLLIFKDSFNIAFAVEAFPSSSCDNYPSISLGFCMWTMGIIMESALLWGSMRHMQNAYLTQCLTYYCEHLLDVDN